MGLYLTLLPFDGGDDSRAFSHTVIECDQTYDLFDKIRELPSVRVPKDFNSYVAGGANPHYGNTQKDADKKPLLFTRVRDLLTLKNDEDVKNGRRNKAAWAYLAKLPKDTRIALYWH